MIKLKDLLNEAAAKTPDFIVTSIPADSIPPVNISKADVGLGLSMFDALGRGWTLNNKDYKLDYHNGKVALVLTKQGKLAVRVKSGHDPKYVEKIEKFANDYLTKFAKNIKKTESVNEAKPAVVGNVNAFGPSKVLGKGGKVLGFVPDTPNAIATLIQDYPNVQAIEFKSPFFFDFNSYKSIKKGDKAWKELMSRGVDKATKAALKKDFQLKESVNEAVDIKDGKYRFYSKDGVGYLTYAGKELSSGDFDWDDGSNSYWMSHSSWGGQKAFDTGKDVINYFKSKKITTESVNEERILVRKVMGDDAEKFLKKYPKVKQVMSVIAKKNTDLMKGYKAFLKFKDAQEDYLGGRAEVSSSPTFGSKTFYKYDWGNLKNHWPEVYQYIYTLHFGGLDGATVEGINEAMGNDKSMLALADVLSNSMEHYDEKDFLQSVRGGQGWSGIPGFQNSGLIPVFKSIYKKYWTVSPQNRTNWSLKDWTNWLKPFGLEENWDSEMNTVEESTPGEQIQNLNNRLTKLRQDMAKAKSPEAKNVIQARMKNALQKLSDKKKDMGIKKP